MAQGQGNGQTGPGKGQASGQRGRGTPESTNFQREKLNTAGLNPGEPAMVLPESGESLPGTAELPTGGARRERIEELAGDMQKEPLTVERREQLQKYHALILGGLPSEERVGASEERVGASEERVGASEESVGASEESPAERNTTEGDE